MFDFPRREFFNGNLMSTATMIGTWVFMEISRHFCLILTKFRISGHIYMKEHNIKFQGNISSVSCADIHKQTTDGLMDRHDKAHSCSSRLHELSKNWIFFSICTFLSWYWWRF
jgi:hypothetical protein